MNHIIPTATSADEAHRGASIAVLPVGSFEQHGNHLPLSADTLIACLIARNLADKYKLFLLPPLTISCSHEHAGWQGTVSISAATLHAVIADVITSLKASGVSKLLIVNGHGGNYVLSNIVQEASMSGSRVALFPLKNDWQVAREKAGCQINGHDDMHAGELETSILLYAMPEVVRPSYKSSDYITTHRPHLLSLGMRNYTKTGVIGQPSLASAEKGEIVLAVLTDQAAAYIDVL